MTFNTEARRMIIISWNQVASELPPFWTVSLTTPWKASSFLMSPPAG